MTSDNDSQWLSKRYVSRRAALRAGILGAAIPGILYVAKSAGSADAADGDIYIPGAPNFLELGHGWPGKEANAGKITYQKWSDALDIVGAGTAAGYRKVKIWDDLYVQGLLNLRSYVVDPVVPPAWTAFLYAKNVNGQSKPFWKDTTGTAQPLVARSATLIVAASNASPRSKLGADYVCDGTADEVEINAAIAALPTRGGKVVLSEGKFTIAAPILIQDKCVHLQGMGPGWAHAWYDADVGATVITAAATYNNDFISVRTSDGSREKRGLTGGTTISDLKVYQNFPGKGYESAHGIHVYGQEGASICDTIFVDRCVVSGVGGHGFYMQGGDQHVTNCTALCCWKSGFWMEDDSIMNNIIAGGNSRGATGGGVTDDEVMLCGFCCASNLYVYGGAKGGITCYGDGGSGTTVSNFIIDAEAENAFMVVNTTDVAISNGFIRGGGMHTHGDTQQAGICIMDGSARVNVSNVAIMNLEGYGGDPASDLFDGVLIRTSKNVTISGCSVYSMGKQAVRLTGSQYCTISDCHFVDSGQAGDNTYSDIKLEAESGTNSTYNRVHDCTFRNTTGVHPRYGIEEADANQDDNSYHDNHLDGNQGTKAIYIAGANSRAYRNKGYVTESNGTATVPNGSTYVEVTHGLSATPNAKDISVTPTNGLGNASKFWISDVGVSTFRINVDTSPGATTATFAWHAEML